MRQPPDGPSPARPSPDPNHQPGREDRFLPEILGQPAAIRRAAAAVADQEARLADLAVAAVAADRFLLAGMGGSRHVCLIPASRLARRGVRATVADASELLHAGAPTLRPNDLLVLVSQSGRSAETVRLAGAPSGRAGGRPFLVSVTNGLDNPLAEASDVALDTRAGRELGPSTLTFAAAATVLDSVSMVLAGETPGGAAVETGRIAAAADGMTRLLTNADRLSRRMRDWLGERRNLFVLGRGAGRGAAGMGALLMKEAARYPAEAMGVAEFRHGPFELAGPEAAVAVLALDPETGPLDMALAQDVARAGGAALVIAGPAVAGRGAGAETDAATGGDVPTVRVEGGELAAIVSAVPLQLLAWRLALERGRNGELTVATKVTTRE